MKCSKIKFSHDFPVKWCGFSVRTGLPFMFISCVNDPEAVVHPGTERAVPVWLVWLRTAAWADIYHSVVVSEMELPWVRAGVPWQREEKLTLRSQTEYLVTSLWDISFHLQSRSAFHFIHRAELHLISSTEQSCSELYCVWPAGYLTMPSVA